MTSKKELLLNVLYSTQDKIDSHEEVLTFLKAIKEALETKEDLVTIADLDGFWFLNSSIEQVYEDLYNLELVKEEIREALEEVPSCPTGNCGL